MIDIRAALVGLAAVVFSTSLVGEEVAPPNRQSVESLVGAVISAHDSLDVGQEASANARACLEGLVWPVAEFDVVCETAVNADQGDLLVRFPSPVASGDAQNDRVAMEWYVARDQEGKPRNARSVVVIHESGSRMTVGRIFARGLQTKGLHAFMIQLPFYGQRKSADNRLDKSNVVVMLRQAIADVRRARDAVAVLPWVDQSHFAVQGTSLGGFVAATSASLDDGYDSVFLMLAGGELYDLIQNGQKDAAKVREELEKAGLTGERLKVLADRIEPTRVAHRLDPQRTWLFSATRDTVVPPKNAHALALAANLDDEHHIRMLANHYTGIVYLPSMLEIIAGHVAEFDSERPLESP